MNQEKFQYPSPLKKHQNCEQAKKLLGTTKVQNA